MNQELAKREKLDNTWFLVAFLGIVASRYSLELSLNMQIFVTFTVLVTVGFVHGLDDMKKLHQLCSQLKMKNLTSILSTAYLVLCFIYYLVWHHFPVAFLALFLAFSIVHFIAVESDHSLPKLRWLAIATGSMPIVVTSISHWQEANYIFNIIAPGWMHLVNSISAESMQASMVALYFLPLTYLLYKGFTSGSRKSVYFYSSITYLAYFLSFALLSPLLSFSLYFVFRHVPIQSTQSAKAITAETKKFFTSKSLIQIILVSWILLFAIFSTQNLSQLSVDQLTLRLTFICIACLTLPHNILDLVNRKLAAPTCC